jgi:Ca-activated chloride channel family protein
MRFLRPDLFAWLAGGFALAALVRWRVRRPYAAATTVRWLRGWQYRASWSRRLPLVLVVAGLILVGLAAMQPVIPFSESEVQSRGLDIAMVLDLSSSMQEEMEPPSLAQLAKDPRRPPGRTRLESTKAAIRAFVRGRRDDRIALVVFSDHAYVVSPLTFDYDYLLHYIDMVDDKILQGEGQTAIGDGLALANYLLARQSMGALRSHQVIVLFTDGENNRGRDPVESLKDANDAAIRVHFVGVDLEDDIRKKPEVQRLLAAVLQYGGRYFNATTSRDLVTASSAIDAIEKGVLVNKVQVHDAPVYHWFAIPALLCLVVAMALRAVPYFVDQT